MPTKLIVTFGTSHHDPRGKTLEGCYSVVTGRDYDACRTIIEEVRGDRFAFTYTSEEAAGVEAYGLRLVPLEPSCWICPACRERPSQEGLICERCDFDARR